jgi:DNA topoisomerase III
VLTAVPVPTGVPRRAAGRASPKREKKRAGAVARRREPPAGFAAVVLGACPLCQSEVVEQEKFYSCGGRAQGCRFAIWKTIAGKRIGVRAVQALLREGKSPVLKGFKSKSGRPFEARLKLDGGEVRFEFGP